MVCLELSAYIGELACVYMRVKLLSTGVEVDLLLEMLLTVVA